MASRQHRGSQGRCLYRSGGMRKQSQNDMQGPYMLLLVSLSKRSRSNTIQTGLLESAYGGLSTSFWSLDAVSESVWHAGAICAAACEPGWRQQEQHNTIRVAGVCLPRPLQALQEECEVHYPGPTQQPPEDLAVLPASLCLSQSPPQDPQGDQSLLRDQGCLSACFGIFPVITNSEPGQSWMRERRLCMIH